MITLSKQIRIMRKDKVSDFKIANFKVLGDAANKKIGGGIKAENAMLVNVEELKTYMPHILGVSPNSTEWGKALHNYVRSISVPVEPNGNKMEIGFVFDFTDIDRKLALDQLIKDNKLDADEKSIVSHITKNIHRNFWWKFGRPIDPADYFLWRYVQNYRKVANSPSDADKSSNISFYIVDSEDVKKTKSLVFKVKNEANSQYFKLSDSVSKVKTVLFAAGKGMEVLAAKDTEDLLIALDNYKESSPTAFIKLANNVDKLKESAFVQECVTRGVFAKLPNTELITDNDTGNTLGGSVEEVIIFLRDETNSKYLNEVKGRLKNKSL